MGRFEESFEIVRRLVAGERVTFSGRFAAVHDAVLLPTPARTIPLMVGSHGERMLRATLPHVDAWNTWHAPYGNTVEGFDAMNRRITEIAEDVGRDPGTVERSACVYVAADPEAVARQNTEGSPPVALDRLAKHLGALASVGATEAILVSTPIDEASLRRVANAVEA